MATRSTIAVRISPTKRLNIYCHWDGYPQGVGATLLEHYKDRDKAIALVSLGDISSLGKRIYPLSDNHSFDSSEEGTTVYYGRDRGEKGVQPRQLSNDDEPDYEEFNYFFDGIEWFVDGKPLTREMCGLS